MMVSVLVLIGDNCDAVGVGFAYGRQSTVQAFAHFKIVSEIAIIEKFVIPLQSIDTQVECLH